jgi:hypothetical protein
MVRRGMTTVITLDNMLIAAFGLVVVIASTLAFFHTSRLTAIAQKLTGIIYGRFVARRVNRGAVTVTTVLSTVVGIMFVLLGLSDGFTTGD